MTLQKQTCNNFYKYYFNNPYRKNKVKNFFLVKKDMLQRLESATMNNYNNNNNPQCGLYNYFYI